MKPLRKISVAERAALQLQESIASGALTGVLPGMRELGKVIDISPTSLQKALALLVERGVLRRTGAGKRYEVIANATSSPGAATQTKKLWIVEPVENPQLSALPTAMLKLMEGRLARMHWECEWSMEIIDQNRSHKKHWKELLRVRKPDAILLVGPHRSTAEWAAGCGMPVCCIGGDTKGLELVTISFDAMHMVTTALEKLLELGHADIFLPLTVRTPGFVERVHESMTKALAAHGLVFSRAWHSPSAEHYTGAALGELLERRFAKRAPTALIGFGSSILTMMGFMLKHGYRVPKDISLVTLGGYHDIGWVHPEVAHFDFDWKRVVKSVEKWLGSKQPQGKEQSVLILPSWIEGETIAPPPI